MEAELKRAREESAKLAKEAANAAKVKEAEIIKLKKQLAASEEKKIERKRGRVQDSDELHDRLATHGSDPAFTVAIVTHLERAKLDNLREREQREEEIREMKRQTKEMDKRNSVLLDQLHATSQKFDISVNEKENFRCELVRQQDLVLAAYKEVEKIKIESQVKEAKHEALIAKATAEAKYAELKIESEKKDILHKEYSTNILKDRILQRLRPEDIPSLFEKLLGTT